jgi:DNA-binding XRE family transcriptional regulator
MVDKRRKPRPKEQQMALRIAFYADIAAGCLSANEAVKTMRALSGLTQAEFAAHRGVALRVIKEIESGKGNPTLESLQKIGAIFGLEPAFRLKPRDDSN